MLKPTLTFIGIFFFCSLLAQIPEFKQNYTPLTSSGQLPEIYTRSASEKASQDLQSLDNTRGVKNRSEKRKFYLSSNFHQDRLLRSGRLLFNDPVSVFVNRVADKAFKDLPEIRKQIRIYVVKSEVVNAYCFDNGIILVNTGLVAQLDNEAQLAFILCHEASHFIKKHSIENYVHQATRRGRYTTNVDMEDYKYSQDAELEADVQGVKYYKSSHYTYKGIVGAFNVLKYSYLPFDEIVFNKTFFEDSNLVFANNLFLKEIAPIKKDEDYDDEKSSHPNIKKRKEAVGKELGEFSDEGREKFLVDQNEFYRVRELARFESCRLGLLNRDYARCVYNCYMLMKKYPENIYLKTTLGKALFEIAALKAPKVSEYHNVLTLDLVDNSKGDNIDLDYSSKEGNSQQVYHLFNKLNALQSSVLALNYNWKLRKELNGKDVSVNRLCDSLFILMAVNNETGLAYFNRLTRRQYANSLKPQPVSKDSAAAPPAKKFTSLADMDDTEADSKTKRIETQNETSKVLLNSDSVAAAKLELYFDQYAFADFFKDTAFVARYKKAVDVQDRVREKRKMEWRKPEKNKGGLGVDRIVILDPFYMKLSERGGGGIRYFASDEKLASYGNILKHNAGLAGLDFDYIDSRTIKKDEMERYNDYTLLNDWMTEFLNHDFNPNTLVLNNDATARLKEKYNTRYVLWSGVINVKIKKENLGLAVLGTLLIYPAVFTIPYLLRKEEKTYYVSVLFDLAANKMQFYHTVALRMSDTHDFLNAFVYDTMLSIKQAPKYKH